MKAPERTTAEVFPRYLGGEVLADSATLKWSGLFARRYRFPRVVDGFLVPATAEPLITCHLSGSAEFQERDVGGAWVPRQVRRGDISWIVPIPGTTKLHRLEENLGAADVGLTPEDLCAIESASSNITLAGARYPEFHEKMTGR